MDSKKLFGVIVIVILLVAVPVTLYLVRQTQIFKPRAGNVNESRIDVFQGGSELPDQPAGSGAPTYAITDPNVQLKIYYVPSPTP